MLGIDLKI